MAHRVTVHVCDACFTGVRDGAAPVKVVTHPDARTWGACPHIAAEILRADPRQSDMFAGPNPDKES